MRMLAPLRSKRCHIGMSILVTVAIAWHLLSIYRMCVITDRDGRMLEQQIALACQQNVVGDSVEVRLPALDGHKQISAFLIFPGASAASVNRVMGAAYSTHVKTLVVKCAEQASLPVFAYIDGDSIQSRPIVIDAYCAGGIVGPAKAGDCLIVRILPKECGLSAIQISVSSHGVDEMSNRP